MAVGLDSYAPSCSGPCEPWAHLDPSSPASFLGATSVFDSCDASTAHERSPVKSVRFQALPPEDLKAPVFASVDSLRGLVAQETDRWTKGFQRLERRVEQLRSEAQAAAAEGSDALRGERKRLEHMQADMVYIGAALQGMREHLGMACGSPSGSADGREWWEVAAKRINSLDERQGVLDDRVKALRVEVREIVAQEAEQRLEGLQRLERSQQGSNLTAIPSLPPETLRNLQLQESNGEAASKALNLCAELAERLSKSERQQQLQGSAIQDGLQQMQKHSKSQAKLQGDVQLRVEELARAHNSVARATREAQPEMEQRFGALDAAVTGLRRGLEERFELLGEQLQERLLRLAEERLQNRTEELQHQGERELDRRLAALDRSLVSLQRGCEDKFAALMDRSTLQGRATEAAQARLEELAQQQAGVARAARESQLDLDRRLSGVTSQLATEAERAGQLGQQLGQWEQRLEALGSRMDLHCNSLRSEAERADVECRQESQKRKDTEGLLVSLLGELDIIRTQIDHRSGSSALGEAPPLPSALDRSRRRPLQRLVAAGCEPVSCNEARYPEADLGPPQLSLGILQDAEFSPQRPMHLFTSSVASGSSREIHS